MNFNDHLRIAQQRRVNKRRCFFVCVAVVAMASLSACTSLVPPKATSHVVVGEKLLAQHFSLYGRISVRVNDRIDSGQIRWHRNADEERIGLYSPLGSQVAELVSDRRTRAVTLRQGKETTSSASVAALTMSLFGVPLDLERMAAWAQGVGLVENEVTDIAFDNGEIWRVSAERYQSVGNHQFASRVIATSGDIVVRLVVDEWTPH